MITELFQFAPLKPGEELIDSDFFRKKLEIFTVLLGRVKVNAGQDAAEATIPKLLPLATTDQVKAVTSTRQGASSLVNT